MGWTLRTKLDRFVNLVALAIIGIYGLSSSRKGALIVSDVSIKKPTNTSIFNNHIKFSTILDGGSSMDDESAMDTTTSTAEKDTLPTVSKRTFDGRPRVLIANGCSGSSVTLRVARDIVTAHYGLSAHPEEHYELFRPTKNPMFQKAKGIVGPAATKDAAVKKALELMHQQAQQQNKVFFAKIFYPKTQFQAYYDFMKNELNATIASEIRTNVIDKTICYVRDCFTNREAGYYPVFASNGSRTNLCYERRKMPDANIMARMAPGDWPGYLQELQRSNERHIRNYQHEFPSYTTPTYEDLFAYTKRPSSEEVFQASVAAWVKLVEPLITDGGVDVTIVERILRPNHATRPPDPPHRDLIYNYNESIAMLWQQAPSLARQFLRE